jgi:hypothetical protein
VESRPFRHTLPQASVLLQLTDALAEFPDIPGPAQESSFPIRHDGGEASDSRCNDRLAEQLGLKDNQWHSIVKRWQNQDVCLLH